MNTVLALDPGVDYAIAKFTDGVLVDVRFQEIPCFECDVLVVEFPKVRKNGNADPNAIVRLAWTAGIIAGSIDYQMHAEVPTVSIPKSIVKKRVVGHLSAAELENLGAAMLRVAPGKQHNMYDAVRHGLVYLGRMRA